MILIVHNRYREAGGEERAVDDLRWLLAEMGEEAEVLERSSALLGQGRAASSMLRGGFHPDDVAAAVRRTRARIVHAHNLHPTFGWRALDAARRSGARVVLHLHNYRLVCAIGSCFVSSRDCTRCHARNTLPGIWHNCRGKRTESAVYGAALALWQQRIVRATDLFLVPSEFARERLLVLGAPIADNVHVVPHVIRSFAPASSADKGTFALVSSRLSPEKGVGVAIAAASAAQVPLLVVGGGPEERTLRANATGEVQFAGRLDPIDVAELRRNAALAIVPSRAAETFGLSAAEAMAAGLPVVASNIGALPEIVPTEGLVRTDDTASFAAAIGQLFGDVELGNRSLHRIRAHTAPHVTAARLRAAYDRIL